MMSKSELLNRVGFFMIAAHLLYELYLLLESEPSSAVPVLGDDKQLLVFALFIVALIVAVALSNIETSNKAIFLICLGISSLLSFLFLLLYLLVTITSLRWLNVIPVFGWGFIIAANIMRYREEVS